MSAARLRGERRRRHELGHLRGELRQPDLVLRGDLAEEGEQPGLGVHELVLVLHRARVVEDEHHARGLAVAPPGGEDLVEHRRLGQRQLAPRLGRVGAVGRAHEAGRLGLGVAGAKAVAAGQVGVDLAGQELLEGARGLAIGRRHPVGVEHDVGRVAEERALLRIERHELGVRAAPAVEVDDRRLLHRHRRGVGQAALAELVLDEQRRVAVMHDRALEVLDARGDLGDVGVGQPLLLARERVVGAGHRLGARGRAVGVGVHVLEAPEVGLAAGRPPARIGGQARRCPRRRPPCADSRAPAPSAPTSRSPAACARSTGCPGPRRACRRGGSAGAPRTSRRATTRRAAGARGRSRSPRRRSSSPSSRRRRACRPTCWPQALNFATTALSSCSFSGETTNDSCWLPAGRGRGHRRAARRCRASPCRRRPTR